MTTTRNFEINTNGCFLVPEFSATGGVSYRRTNRREIESGTRLVEDFETRKEVDDVALVTESKSIINRAYATLEKHTVRTAVGYWAAPEAELAVREALQALESEAVDFNVRAKAAHSERRVRVAVYAVGLIMDDAAAAQRLRETIVERLTGLQSALAHADRSAFDKVWEHASRLDALATGIQADAIRMALDSAKRSRSEITELVRDGLVPSEIGSRLDLGPLESAISLFQ